MNGKRSILLLPALLIFLLAACSPASSPPITYEPAQLRFSGERAYAVEEEFVTRFTNRHSGTEQSRLATEWLQDQFESAGWTCQIDQWEVVNYSQPVTLMNPVCKLPGKKSNDPREILVVAHRDQSPLTIQGADDDGSGVAILLHLAEIFGAEEPPSYRLVFIATDAEEYGMLGSKRYIDTHPNPENIIAGFSLDNLGMRYYDSMNMELVSQFNGYGQIWLPLAVRDAVSAADGSWHVNLKTPVDQVLDQAVPVSLTDQGPIISAGVPAIGFSAGYPAEYSELHYNLWHDPDDTMDYQSPKSLQESGLIVEASIRQLLSMDTFPEESGPYLYFDSSQQVLRGFPLYLIFIGFLGLFFLGSYFVGGTGFKQKVAGWPGAFIHFLGFWLPLVAAIFLLYLFVDVGILVEYELYPATTKDPNLLNPDWLAVSLFLGGLAIFLFVGRGLARKVLHRQDALQYGATKSLALLLIGIVGLYILIVNPFSLLFLVPVLFWFLISGKRGVWKLLDLLFFLLGGLVLYALVYFFGFQILRYGIVFLWMFLNMFATGTIGFGALMAGTAVLAAGLALVVTPPHK
jgi:MFS family permease